VKTGPGLGSRGLRAGPGRPIELRAGPLSFAFSAGDLRGIALNGREIIRRVYVAVRDLEWGTAPNAISGLRATSRTDASSVGFTAVSANAHVDFRWEARIDGHDDGRVSFSFSGEAARDFQRNRIGICVLHPAALAGVPCRWGTTAGETGRGSFPVDVAPHQPFRDLRWFSHQAGPDLWVRLDFEGDVFEMEDQRNWTDGSFKIYGTPLALPFPVAVRAGDRVSQRVTLSLEGSPQPGTDARIPSRQRRSLPRIEVGGPSGRTLSRIGFGLETSEKSVDSSRRLVEGLDLDHLRIECDLDLEDWKATLPASLQAVRRVARPCWCLLVTTASEIPAGVVREFIEAGVAPEAVLVTRNVPPWDTDTRLAECTRAVFAAGGLRPRIGGGTDANFAELNRTRPSVAVLDLVFFAAHPQVHAADDRSIMENLEGLAPAVRTAIRFSGGKPVCLSPLTFAPRVDPAVPDRRAYPIPRDRMRFRDLRQASPFCGPWALAAVHRLSAAGAHAVTFCDLSGLGEANRPDLRYPIHDVFRRLAGWRGAELLEVSCADPFVDVLALRSGTRVMILAANLSSEPRTVAVAGVRLHLAGYGVAGD
jgi:D-apionolactonase